jgi:hypothetical protein
MRRDSSVGRGYAPAIHAAAPASPTATQEAPLRAGLALLVGAGAPAVPESVAFCGTSELPESTAVVVLIDTPATEPAVGIWSDVAIVTLGRAVLSVTVVTDVLLVDGSDDDDAEAKVEAEAEESEEKKLVVERVEKDMGPVPVA